MTTATERAAAQPSPRFWVGTTGGRRDAGFGRLAGLDGLRAVAVIAVLLYHAGLLSGGFLGVDVFFVISGFLITALLLTEWQQHNRIDVKRFWLRRARRLLPALFLLLAVVTLFAVLAVPSEVARLRGDVLAAVAYVTNWFLIVGQQSYFDDLSRPSPLRHLWSLAVEEQFYLLWPLLLMGLLFFLRRRGALISVIVLAAASTIWMAALFDPTADPSRVYYGTDTRIAGLLIGAALAFLWVARPAWHNLDGKIDSWRATNPEDRLVADALAVAGLAVVAAFFLLVDDQSPFLYTGGFAILSIATALVIGAVIHPASHIGPLVLEWAPLRWVGVRSYGIYLWHWPIYMFTRPGIDVNVEGWANTALRLGLTVVLAELSFRFVEDPIRRGVVGAIWQDWRKMPARDRRSAKRVLVPIGAVLALTVAVLGSQIVRATPAPVPAYLAISSVDIYDNSSLPPTASGHLVVPGTVLPGGPSATPTVAPSSGATATAGRTAPPATPPSSATPQIAARGYAVGDSVMLGAAPALAAQIRGLEVDAAVGRHWYQGIALVQSRASAGTLPSLVVIDLGNNDTLRPRDFDSMMAAIGPNRDAIFINLRLPRDWEAPNNQVIQDGVSRYPNAYLVDWLGASDAHPEYFYDDGMHLRAAGQKVYASLVAVAVGHLVAR